MISSFLFKLSLFFLRNSMEIHKKTVKNESKSTVNNRTRCQLPYQINLSPVKANAWSLSLDLKNETCIIYYVERNDS